MTQNKLIGWLTKGWTLFVAPEHEHRITKSAARLNRQLTESGPDRGSASAVRSQSAPSSIARQSTASAPLAVDESMVAPTKVVCHDLL